ncbi:MAG: PD-(D/E)XK motif protein [Fibrobacter sp.]|nr:PD-(D/E)XK motif protein [Fibrobacter sp.]
MMNYKSRFSEFSKPSFFSRVDADHVLNWHIGVDGLGRKSIEYRSKFTARKVVGTKYIEVSQYKKEEYCTIRFSLCNKELEDLFYKFCEDMVEKTRCVQDPLLGYNAIIERFTLWKKLFNQSQEGLLSEEKIMGLIGEIIFLRDYLFSLYGIEKSVVGWSGQDLTRKDFSYDEMWYEAKAVSYNRDSVSISSLEQLDSDVLGELAVVLLEKMSPSFAGVSLNNLVINVCDKIESVEAKELFLAKVESSGYAYNVAYDGYVYALKSIKRYSVNDEFPRMTPRTVPEGIVSAKYEISLPLLKKFEIF